MEPIPLCQKAILLAESNDLHLYQVHTDHYAAALAPSMAQCAAVAEATRERVPLGLVLEGLSGPEMPSCDDPHPTESLIAQYKEQLRPALPEQVDFLYLRNTGSFASLRCAVLAATDACGHTLMAEIPITAEGLLPFGTEPTAAVCVLQRIGVSTVIFSGEDPDAIEEALVHAAPYARISLGVRIDPAWLTAGRHFPNAELFVPRHAEDAEALYEALQCWQGATVCPRDHDDFLAAPDGTHAHFIDPTIDISEEIALDAHLSEHLLEAEDASGAIKLRVENEEDLIRFEEQVFMISRPVCLCAEQPELLERALRIYPGLALYDGTWTLEPRLIKYFSEKYGMIPL